MGVGHGDDAADVHLYKRGWRIGYIVTSVKCGIVFLGPSLLSGFPSPSLPHLSPLLSACPSHPSPPPLTLAPLTLAPVLSSCRGISVAGSKAWGGAVSGRDSWRGQWGRVVQGWIKVTGSRAWEWEGEERDTESLSNGCIEALTNHLVADNLLLYPSPHAATHMVPVPPRQ